LETRAARLFDKPDPLDGHGAAWIQTGEARGGMKDLAAVEGSGLPELVLKRLRRGAHGILMSFQHARLGSRVFTRRCYVNTMIPPWALNSRSLSAAQFADSTGNASEADKRSTSKHTTWSLPLSFVFPAL
jgi:hypothetical protein